MKNIMFINIQLFAHHKGQGSTKNGRDSKSKRLGVKASDGQHVHAGTIIIRQRGTKVLPGDNVGCGKDYTLFAKAEGVVKFSQASRDKKKVSVCPAEAE